MTTKTPDQFHVRYVVDAIIDANGEGHDYLGQRMNSAFAKAIGDGALTSDTESTVDTYTARVIPIETAGANLDEEELASWIAGQIESGSMRLEEIPLLMARYALSDPADLRNEFVERMGLESSEEDLPAPRG